MKIIVFIIAFIMTVTTINAQSIEKAESYYNNFKTITHNGYTESAQGYTVLLNAAKEYMGAIKNYDEGTSTYERCKKSLLEIFPLIGDGAYFYAERYDKAKTIMFSRVYVDISLMYQLSGSNLINNVDYPNITYFAAYQTFENKDYESAILYYKAYLSTQEQKNRENAFKEIITAYNNIKDYRNVKYYANEALALYPYNHNIAIYGINACKESNDDANMQRFLSFALRNSPKDPALLKNAALCSERSLDFEKATEYWQDLDCLAPNNFDVYMHLAYDYYNTGVQYYELTQQTTRKNDKINYEKSYRTNFTKAIPLLKDVLKEKPYASNIARAIALCYLVTGNDYGFKEANATLTAMRATTVKKNEVPKLDTRYKPVTEPTPIPHPIPTPAPFISDVDKNLPVASQINNNTYAIVIGNEKYKYVCGVDYAENDSKSFARYCELVLGIPKDHIRLLQNATLSEIKEQITFLDTKAKMNPGELNFIFYYAGHGIPNLDKGNAYLLPTDASGTDFESCYELEKLYTQLGAMNIKKATVFLDACFSGMSANGMIFKGRYIEIEPKETEQKGNTVVFCAAGGKQAALPYDEQHHGYFTYFLLKNLKESSGKITYKELSRKLEIEVANKVYDQKNKQQNPQVKASPNLGDKWKSFTLLK